MNAEMKHPGIGKRMNAAEKRGEGGEKGAEKRREVQIM